MCIMNLIHDICLTKINMENVSKWKLFSMIKLKKRLNKDISDFLNLDIFDLANNVLSFLISLDKDIINSIDENIWYTDTFLCIEFADDRNIINSIMYYPKSNRFEVWSQDISYIIYNNTTNCNKINKLWQPLTNGIRERYLYIIIQLADYIKTPSQKLNNNGENVL